MINNGKRLAAVLLGCCLLLPMCSAAELAVNCQSPKSPGKLMGLSVIMRKVMVPPSGGSQRGPRGPHRCFRG